MTRISQVFIIPLILLTLFVSLNSADDWPSSNLNNANSRIVSITGNINIPSLKWHSIFEREVTTPILVVNLMSKEPKLLFGSENTLYLFNSNGNKIWSISLGANIENAPAILTDSFDQQHIIVAAGRQIYSISPEGTLEWKVYLDDFVTSQPVIFDASGNNSNEILISINHPLLLNSTGAVLWERPDVESKFFAIDDIDSDSLPEIFTGFESIIVLEAETGVTKFKKEYSMNPQQLIYSQKLIFQDIYSNLHILNANGNSIFQESKSSDFQAFSENSILVANFKNSPEPQIVYIQNSKINIIDSATQEILKQFNVTTSNKNCLTAADIDSDNEIEIFYTPLNSKEIFSYSYSELEWKYKLPSQLSVCPTFADIDSDNKVEIILGTLKGLYVLDETPNTKPIAHIKSKDYGFIDSEIIFDFSNSSDLEDKSNLKYRWRFNSNPFSTWTTTKNITQSFSDSGKYLIQLEVKDSDGEISNTSKEIGIYSKNQNPVANFSVFPKKIYNNDKAYFTSNSYDREDLAILESRWDFDGDGNYETDWSPSKSVQYSYPKSGSYNVILQVRDSGQEIDQLQKSISILKNPTKITENYTPNHSSRIFLWILISVIGISIIVFLILEIKKLNRN